MSDRAAVGARIRALRIRHGLTLKDVEARSGFSATHVSEIERGRTSPTIPVLVGIADALGVDPNALLADHQRGTTVVGRRALSQDPPASGARRVPLTESIAGGRLRPEIVLVAAHDVAEVPLHGGELAGLVQDGKAELEASGETVRLGVGDGFQLAGEVVLRITNPGPGPVRIVLVAKPSSLAGR